MSPSGAELLRSIKGRISEVDPAAVHEQMNNGATIVDVRETEEFAAGHIPGAKHVPRGYLESRIEGVVPDRSRHLILYCASGNRSAYAARTLLDDLGYENEQTINALNPDVNVIKHPVRIGPENIMDILPDYDIVVDGLDNFPTRYLLNDASVRLKIPVVSAAILGFEGQLSVFKPYDGPCYRCLFPVPPPAELAPSCGANGVLGVLPGTMGLLQATEVIKLILGEGEPLIGRLLMYDALAATVSEVKVRRDPHCPICSRHPEAIADEALGVFPDYEAFCAGAH